MADPAIVTKLEILNGVDLRYEVGLDGWSILPREVIAFFCYQGTGDCYLLCGFLEEFARKREIPIQNVAIFAPPRNFQIFELFRSLDFQRLCLSDQIDLAQIRNLTCNPAVDRFLVAHPSRVAGYQRIDGLTTLPGVTDEQIMAYLLTGSPAARRTAPQVEATAGTSDWRRELGAGRQSVLLVPWARSMQGVRPSVWQQVATALLRQGVQVFQNLPLRREEEPVPGAIPLRISIPDLVSIRDHFGLILASQCGLASILIDSARVNNLVLLVEKIREPIRFHDALYLNDTWPFLYPEKFLVHPNNVLTKEISDDAEAADIEELIETAGDYLGASMAVSRLRLTPVAMPIGEMIDRMTIFQVKMERLRGQKRIESMIEFHRLRKTVARAVDIDSLQPLIARLYSANLRAWELNEKIYGTRQEDIEDQEVMANLGRTIFEAQNINKARVSLKNAISSKVSALEGAENKSFN